VFSRRTFLKTATIAGIATAVSPASLLASEPNRIKYSIPENERKLTFLFQGDSITDGNRGRNSDPNHIMGHGYAFSIASRVGADFPHAGFSFYNRGISGNRVPDLQQRWKTDALDLHPDVLSILVGINDVDHTIKSNESVTDVAAFEQGYRNLLQQSRAANSKIVLVLGLPFVYPVGSRKTNWEKWCDGVAAHKEVVLKLAAEFDAVTVDYPSVFDKAMKDTPADYWIWDGIHPTVCGHELMTREWIKHVGKRLIFLKNYRY
jgi:Lysophospholipase L1 and related esterases